MAQAGLYQTGDSPNQIQEDAEHSRAAGQAGDPSEKIEDNWLIMARDAYTQAESYYEANIRSIHERNMSHFQSRHAPGSKYYTDSYKFRHKGFRPKTRSMVRRQEAALLKSMFSTSEFVKVRASREAHPAHRLSAEVNQALLQYRLENSVPWFQTALGAYQETLTLGICISHQYWDYQEAPKKKSGEEKKPDFADRQEEETPDEKSTAENNQMVPLEDEDDTIDGDFEEVGEVLRDTPACDLRPAENVFFSVGCDWRDPANSSPFIIDKIPMYIDDVKLMAQNGEWYELTTAQLLAGIATDYDGVRRQREKNREDSKDERHQYRGYDIVWVHRNIMRKEGIDWIYYTLGEHYMLSDPIPLREDPQYKWLAPGERPYVIGFSNLEAHTNYPESLVGLGANTQQDANVLNNTRFDNVELSLNRRYIVKRGAMIDYRGLQRNVPGGVTETDDPPNDIRIEAPPDVTASSYQEQDRINADYDELVGMFSGSSMSTNRQMNETVGGMKLMAGDADSLTEYPMMVYMITWVIPVLKQMIRLEQHYESDPALLALMGEKLQVWQRFGIERITDQWIQGDMSIQVVAGFGSANPEQRLQRLAAGFGLIFNLAPAMAQRFDGEEAAKEVMGTLGYTEVERFFPRAGPKVQGTLPQQENKGELTEQDQAKLDQDYRMHAERLEWEITKHYDEKIDREQERLLKREISDQQYQEKLLRLQTDRQTAVDEMKIKLREGSGI